MHVRRQGLLANRMEKIITLDGNQAVQHRPSVGGWLGACRKPLKEPQKGQLLVIKHSTSPPLPLTLGLSIAKGSVNSESATVMLWSHCKCLYSIVSTNTCFSPMAVTQGQARTDTQTRTHRNNLYNGRSPINTEMAVMFNF